MTTFKQWAVVHVPNKEQRDELIRWLCDVLGYVEDRYYRDTDEYVCVAGKGMFMFSRLATCPPGAMNCGTSIPMFRALAALRDDSDYMQWVIKQDGSGRIYRCSDAKINNDKYRKATPAEIVEHFKNQE